MKYKIKPSKLSGVLSSMPSKSMSHRLAIASVLAGNSRIDNLGVSDDISATLGALKSLGWSGFGLKNENTLVSGDTSRKFGDNIVDCRESGSTLRILLPLGMDGQERIFTGTKRLLQRSQEVYEQIAANQGIVFEKYDNKANFGLKVNGKLKSSIFTVRGDISSQFISGLLFALPSLDCDSTINLTGNVESVGYINLTLQVLRDFGIKVTWINDKTLYIKGNQTWKSCGMTVEGDYSHAAFFLVAGAISGQVEVANLKENSLQGDKQIIDILRNFGADIKRIGNNYVCKKADLKAFDVDAKQIPDLVPILAVLASHAEGISHITGAGRLRDKESDRLDAISTELNALGADIQQTNDGLIINGVGKLRGGECKSHKDHRIAMSLAIASTICENNVILSGYCDVAKSAPQFWDEFSSIGGIFEEI